MLEFSGKDLKPTWREKKKLESLSKEIDDTKKS